MPVVPAIRSLASRRKSSGALLHRNRAMMVPGMRSVILVAALGLLAGGCGGGARQQSSLEGTAFTVSVAADAQSAARASGVDLRRLVIASADKALALLPHRGRIQITVRVNPDVTIPEIGIGGYTNPRGNVSLGIDPTHANLRHVLKTWIPSTVSHELHHSSRIRSGPGYGVTLGQAMVSEGLADRFSYEVFPHLPPKPWDHALTKAQEHASWLQARPLLNDHDYSHSEWFYGGGATPRWVGFTLGYDIVGRYLTDHHQSPSDAVTIPAATVLASFHGG